MAPPHVRKFLDSFPFARARRFHQTHSGAITSASSLTGGAISSVPVMTEATAAEPDNVTSNVATDTAASSITERVTGFGDVDTTKAEITPSPVPAAFHMDYGKAKEYMKNIKKFRVLVIGRANAGKTTILQRVCNTADKPDIFDGDGNKIVNTVVQGTLGRGYHNIEDELIFQSNPGYIFHDSSGFEAGSAQQFDKMKKFVIDHAAAKTLGKRIHAIWYCIPMTDYERTVTAAEQKFFNECDTGHVPVVVLLTKVDFLHLVAIEELLDEGVEMEEAKSRAAERESQLLRKWQAHVEHILDQCKFPPNIYLPLGKMHEESTDCTTLIQCTASALNEEGLQRLLISTQQSSIALCITYAVHRAMGGMMRMAIEGAGTLDMGTFESNILSWFPKHQNLDSFADFFGHPLFHPRFDDPRGLPHGGLGHIDLDLNKIVIDDKFHVPSQGITIQALAEHGIKYLLIIEHCYFLLQNQQLPLDTDVISQAVKEYNSSGIAATIHQAIETSIQQHGQNVASLCQAFVTIILDHSMSSKLLF